jgi:transposase
MTEDAPFKLETQNIGALPIVNHYIQRLGIDGILARYLAPVNTQKLNSASCIGVLLRNIVIEREPIYGIREWAERYRPDQLGLKHEQMEFLNDDRVGRALDYLFDADRGSMLTEIVVRAIIEFKLDTSQLNNDSTTITFNGNYSDANGDNKRGKKSLNVTNGFNKDHRPDLKQLLWILTVTADGAVPVHYRACDGNTTDSPTHVDTWNALRAIIGRSDFLYIADCKLCTKKNLNYIDSEGGRFITVVPRSDNDDIWFREHIQTNKVRWKDIEPPFTNLKVDPDEIWKMVESPKASSEGFRVVWAWNSGKEEQDKLGREILIENAISKFEKLETRLRSPRTRLRSRDGIIEEADKILKGPVERWIEYDIHEENENTFKQEKRGRPGPRTRYKQTTRKRYHITWNQRVENIRYDARSDGMFPLITNCKNLTLTEILDKYKYQPKLEKRHQQLKTVYGVTPVLLKSVTRIEGFLFVYFVALLVQALIEREIRLSMRERKIPSIPIYFENRECESPTTDRVLTHFDNIEIHRLWSGKSLVQTFKTPLSEKQKELLKLAGVPIEFYTMLG